MDKKYHRGNGEVVALQNDWAFDKNTLAIETLASSLPNYAYCDPALPVGWIEGEEVYQVYYKSDTKGVDGWWVKFDKEIWDKEQANNRRIWIEPKREQPHEPDFQREAKELYPYPETYSVGTRGIINAQIECSRAAHIKARQMSAGEVEELRDQVRKLRDGVEELIREAPMDMPGLDKAKQLLKETE